MKACHRLSITKSRAGHYRATFTDNARNRIAQSPAFSTRDAARQWAKDNEPRKENA